MENYEPELACHIGFWYKERRKGLYFHVDAEGCPYVFTLCLSHRDGTQSPGARFEELISPFSLEELVTWSISYDLLPPAIKSMVKKTTVATYRAILDEDPERAKELDFQDQRVLFHIENISRMVQ